MIFLQLFHATTKRLWAIYLFKNFKNQIKEFLNLFKTVTIYFM